MVVCIIALIVFAFMGIFSAKYRTYAKEAFRCVARMVTLRPCDTDFDKRVQTKITAKLIKFPRFAGFVHRNFSRLSWAFVIIFFVSLAYVILGFYNLYAYGSCDPHSDFCIFNPTAQGSSCGSEHCATEGCECGTGDVLCTSANNYAPCEGNCTCNTNVCGAALE